VVGEVMTGRLPPGAGGEFSADRGPGGELWGHLE
jgi:hypothetical protein